MIGSPAKPPTLATAVPNWRPGDTIPLGNDRTLRVVAIRRGPKPDGDAVLVVEAGSCDSKKAAAVLSEGSRYDSAVTGFI